MSSIDSCAPVLHENSKLSQVGCFLQEMVCWKDHRYIVLSADGYELKVKYQKIEVGKLKMFGRIFFFASGLFILAGGYLCIRRNQLSKYSIKLSSSEELQIKNITSAVIGKDEKKQRSVQTVIKGSGVIKQKIDDKIIINCFDNLEKLFPLYPNFVSVIKTFVKEKYEVDPQAYTKLTENTFDNIKNLCQYACDNGELACILLKFISFNYITEKSIINAARNGKNKRDYLADYQALQHEFLNKMIIENSLISKNISDMISAEITNVLLNVLSKMECAYCSERRESPLQIIKNHIISFIVSRNSNDKQLAELFHIVCESTEDCLSIPFLNEVTNKQINIIKKAYVPASLEKNIDGDASRQEIIKVKFFKLFIQILSVVTEKRNYIEKAQLRHKILGKLLAAFPDFTLESIKKYATKNNYEVNENELEEGYCAFYYIFISIYHISHTNSKNDKISYLKSALDYLKGKGEGYHISVFKTYVAEACTIEDFSLYLSLTKESLSADLITERYDEIRGTYVEY